MYSKVNQLYIHMDPLFFGFPSNSGHHRVLIEFPVLYSSFSLVINKRGNTLYRKNYEDLQKSVRALRARNVRATSPSGRYCSCLWKVLLLFMEAIRPNLNVNKLGESVSG